MFTSVGGRVGERWTLLSIKKTVLSNREIKYPMLEEQSGRDMDEKAEIDEEGWSYCGVGLCGIWSELVDEELDAILIG